MPQSVEGRTVAAMRDEIQHAYDLFVQGINQASQNRLNAKKAATEGGVKLMARERIKAQIENNLAELNKMKPVKTISNDLVAEIYNADKDTRNEIINGVIKNYKKGVSTQDFGTVGFDKESVADIFAHRKANERYILFTAIPQVLKQGKKIADYNERTKSTITIAAPVVVGNKKVYLGVLVSQNNQKVYGMNYTDERGGKFEINNGAIPTVYAAPFEESNGATITRMAPDDSILQSNKESNIKTQNNAKLQSRDADYLSAVERGDMETAQRMVDEAAEKDIRYQSRDEDFDLDFLFDDDDSIENTFAKEYATHHEDIGEVRTAVFFTAKNLLICCIFYKAVLYLRCKRAAY